ncbi:MAG: 3,4-dihydroxy-2-butanone 4-phosphate synthase [Thermoprotei archaeon]|nr:MAG: 3,4-dihydroxy-2-butanone 4-phosphate synthase [Thermoprotei archaeon]
MGNSVKEAVERLRKGLPVFIFDSGSRENEVDMVYYGGSITSSAITNLRKLAGGLICYSMPLSIGRAIGLRYMDEILRDAGYGKIAGRLLGYGDPPNFSLWVNHIKVITGIRDSDRALTIRELHRIVELILAGKEKEAVEKFNSEFTTPGHVPVLLGRGLEVRRGHTELSLALMELAGLPPSSVIAEMLDGEGAMSYEDARKVAEKLGSVIIEGAEIIEEWLKRQK